MKRIIFFTMLIAMFLVWLVAYKITDKKVFKTSFHGVVKSIEYDAKSQPSVVINSQNYKFNFATGKGEIQIGDSLVKEKDSYLVIQYRCSKYLTEYEWR